MKLIKMTDFVLEQQDWLKNQDDGFETGDFFDRVTTYAKFLSQPLELGMFVPCDEDGNVLTDPCKRNRYCADMCQGSCQTEYNEAKERVLFEGMNQEDFEDLKYSNHCKIVEHIIEDANLTLTQSAIKKLGL